MKKMMQRGFTLIELLVVIAIIGILAATVLAALGTARSSGTDARVKSQLSSVRAQAEIHYTSANNYTAVCANLTGAGLNANTSVWNCNADATRWLVSSDLQNGGYFCVDSTGASKEVTGTLTGPGASTTLACP